MMRRFEFIIRLILVALASFPLSAEPRVVSEIGYRLGARVDTLEWSEPGDGGVPNVAEELVFDHVKVFEFGVVGRMIGHTGFTLVGDVAIGKVLDGNNRNSDYIGPNRTQETARILGSSDGENTWDVTVGFGQAVCLPWWQVVVIPMMGYSHHMQHYAIRNGNQVVGPGATPLGEIDGLDSWYEAHWKGPWFGAEVELPIWRTLCARIVGRYHFSSRYTAEGMFNLKSDADNDYTHEANAQGYTVEGMLTYPSESGWTFGMTGKWKDWTADRGNQRTFLMTPGTNLVGIFLDNQFNGASWQSYSISLTATKGF